MTLSRVHLVAALVATLTIALFFASTVFVEALGNHPAVARAKRLIVVPGLFVLVPAIAVTGGTGFVLSRGWQSPVVARKKRRMPVIAGNGLLILVPAALILDRWAAAGAFDARFYVGGRAPRRWDELDPDGAEHTGRPPAERAVPSASAFFAISASVGAVLPQCVMRMSHSPRESA